MSSTAVMDGAKEQRRFNEIGLSRRRVNHSTEPNYLRGEPRSGLDWPRRGPLEGCHRSLMEGTRTYWHAHQDGGPARLATSVVHVSARELQHSLKVLSERIAQLFPACQRLFGPLPQSPQRVQHPASDLLFHHVGVHRSFLPQRWPVSGTTATFLLNTVATQLVRSGERRLHIRRRGRRPNDEQPHHTRHLVEHLRLHRSRQVEAL
jgi:hypothetical protein